MMEHNVTYQRPYMSWFAGSCRPRTRIPPPGSVAGSRHRRDTRCGRPARAGGGGKQGGWSGGEGGTTSSGRWGTPDGCDRGGLGMLGMLAAGMSPVDTRPRARRTAADRATPDSGVCRASSSSSFAGSLPSRTCPQTRGPAPSSCPSDPRRFPWWAPSGSSRSGTGCASRCSATLFYPSSKRETWCWWTHKSLAGSAACPGSLWWLLQSEPRRNKAASAGCSPAQTPAPGTTSWSWCPGASPSARPVLSFLRPWLGDRRACGPAGDCRRRTALLTRAETGPSVNAPAGVHTPPTRVLSSRRVPTAFMKVYWTTGEPEWVEKRATRKCFHAHHSNILTCSTQSQVKTLVGSKQCLIFLGFLKKLCTRYLQHTC